MCNTKRVYVANPNNPQTAIPTNLVTDGMGYSYQPHTGPTVQKLTAGCARDGEPVITKAMYEGISSAVKANGGSAAIFAAETQNSVVTPVRAEVPDSSGAPLRLYSITLDNTNVNAETRVILGDYSETYALSNAVPALPAGFLVGGTFGAQSIAQFNKRSGLIPKRVKGIRYDVSDAAVYSQMGVSYFSTGPLNSNHRVDQINLAALVENNQFNPKLQLDDNPYLFNASTGLDIYVPANEKITLTFQIQSEGQGALMQLVNNK